MAYDLFMTPPDVIELARSAMGKIDFDPASNYIAQQYVRAGEFCIAPNDLESLTQSYITMPRIDGLKQNWYGNVWINPPYSNGNIDAFVDKAIEQWGRLVVLSPNGWAIDKMIILVNSATDTKWYHKLMDHADAMLFWKGRIKFWKMFDGKAWDKWEGEKSKKEGNGKIGNSPRFLNTLFFFGRNNYDMAHYKNTFEHKGKFIKL